MTTDELRAAADRCRGLEGPGWVDVENAPPECVADLLTLARGWLAEHPADDSEPVTMTWLESVGFYRPMQVAAGALMATEACVEGGNATRLPVVGVEFPRGRRPDVVPVWRVWVYGHPRDFSYCPTRGHVRRLLQALGAA